MRGAVRRRPAGHHLEHSEARADEVAEEVRVYPGEEVDGEDVEHGEDEDEDEDGGEDGGGGLVEGQHEQVEGAEAAEDADDAEGPDGPENVGHARLGKEEGDDREKDNCRICYVIGKKMG